MKPVVVIDLFAGAGGFTEGAISAGAKVAVAIDFWEPAVLLHRHNQPNVLMVQHKLGDFQKDDDLIRKYLSRYPNYHVHLHGSPPCQALSNASKTDPSEGMGMVLHFLDLVEHIQPDSWSMENVVPMRKRLPEGTPSVILNSADFGVPQTRRRCIAGEGWEAIPTHSKEEWRSVLDALPHLADEIEGLLLMDSGRSSAKTCGVNPKTGEKAGGSGPLFRNLEEPSYTIMSSPRTICVNMDGCGESNSRRAKSADVPISEPAKTVRGAIGAPTIRLEALGSNSKREADRPIDEPSKTICGSGNQVGPRLFEHFTHNVGGSTTSTGEAAENRDRVVTKPSKVIRAHHTTIRDRTEWDKPKKIRSLTVQETAALQGFPTTFEWELPGIRKKDIWTAIGNAVCPPVAEAIIRGIIQ